MELKELWFLTDLIIFVWFYTNWTQLHHPPSFTLFLSNLKNKVTQGYIMKSKKMALHIFSRHYLIFYGHWEPLMIVSYPISLPNKKITLTVCVFLSPLVFLSQETWHWAISTQDDLFFLCLVPLPPSKQLRLSKASTVDRVVVPFRLASRTERPVQNQFLGPSKHENIS